VSNYNQLKIRIIHRGKKYLLIKNKSENQIEEVEGAYQNDITKIFKNGFDNLVNNDVIDKEYEEIKNKNDNNTVSSSQSQSQSQSLTSSSSSKLPKFHFDYYSKKIIFHPNSLYHEHNAKKYNTIDANVDKDKLFSSVTIVLTTGNRKELTYFPKYPWYWDGVELFNGISVRPRPFYHPNYLSVSWKPRHDVFSMDSSSVINKLVSTTSSGKQSNHSSSSSSTSHENDKNKRNFTLSLTRTNSF